MTGRRRSREDSKLAWEEVSTIYSGKVHPLPLTESGIKMNPSSNAVSGSHNNVQHNDMVFETTTRKGSNSENFTYTGEYISPYGRTPFPKPRPAVRKGGGRSSSLEQHGGRQSKEGMMKRRQSSSKRMQKVNSPRMAALAGGLFLNRNYSDRRALEETLESAKRVQKELEKADADKSSVKVREEEVGEEEEEEEELEFTRLSFFVFAFFSRGRTSCRRKPSTVLRN